MCIPRWILMVRPSAMTDWWGSANALNLWLSSRFLSMKSCIATDGVFSQDALSVKDMVRCLGRVRTLCLLACFRIFFSCLRASW